jgi:hypothetical protein
MAMRLTHGAYPKPNVLIANVRVFIDFLLDEVGQSLAAISIMR